MSESASVVAREWTFDKLLKTGKRNSKQPAEGPGGLVLQNVRHQQYHLARDIRVARVWIGSTDLPGPARALELGSDDLPVADSGEIKLPEQQGLIKPFQPPLRYWASFQTTGPVLGPGSQKLTIRQDYLFTDYSKNPPHEPADSSTPRACILSSAFRTRPAPATRYAST